MLKTKHIKPLLPVVISILLVTPAGGDYRDGQLMQGAWRGANGKVVSCVSSDAKNAMLAARMQGEAMFLVEQEGVSIRHVEVQKTRMKPDLSVTEHYDSVTLSEASGELKSRQVNQWRAKDEGLICVELEQAKAQH